MDIDLSTDAPPSSGRTLQLAETFAEIVRTLNHQTRHHEALQYPSEADRLLRKLARGIAGLPQLLGQLDHWLAAEDDAERIEVPSGEHQGNPLLAVATARALLDTARSAAGALHAALDSAAQVTCTLAAREDGSDD